jgi:hypothetical protein
MLAFVAWLALCKRLKHNAYHREYAALRSWSGTGRGIHAHSRGEADDLQRLNPRTDDGRARR